MTLLELVNRCRLECGVSGGDLETVAAPTKDSQLIINWITQADLEIQEMYPDWQFLRESIEIPLIEGQAEYPVASISGVTNFSTWKEDSFRIYMPSIGYGTETYIDAVPYNYYRDYWQFNARRSVAARPVSVSVGPDKALWFGPAPLSGYSAVCEYYKAPTLMAADADTSLIPSRFQMVIVYKAMMDYGSYQAAPEVYARGEKKYLEMLGRLMSNQLPSIWIEGPLA